MNINLTRKLAKLFLVVLIICHTNNLYSQQSPSNIPLPSISVQFNQQDSKNELTLSLQLLLIITVLSLAPSILIMMTCFTRIIVVFHFLRQALGTQTQPPNQLLVGLALFLTFFVMQPVLDRANKEGIQPYLRDEITQAQALENIVQPFREFMLKHTREEDLGLFLRLSGVTTKPKDVSEVSTWTIIPAFCISELRIAFQIGFLLFVPFLVLDMVIASILMSLGMFLLPPQLISLPIKILLFILVDGWYLIIDSLMKNIMK